MGVIGRAVHAEMHGGTCVGAATCLMGNHHMCVVCTASAQRRCACCGNSMHRLCALLYLVVHYPMQRIINQRAHAGYMLSGGFGSLTTMFGLACDQLVSLQAVLYNGTVVRANATHHQDLLWAACGGGGGVAVITEWEVRVLRLPDPDNLYYVYLAYDPLDMRNLAKAYHRTLDMLAGSNNGRFGGGLFIGTVFKGWFNGPLDQALEFLQAAGLIGSDIKMDASQPSRNEYVAARHPKGVVLVKYPSWITSQYMVRTV